jgi:Zn-dependent metalloprotease
MSFVSEHILEELAKSGVGNARLTILQDEMNLQDEMSSDARRSAVTKKMTAFAFGLRAAATATGIDRSVYDSQQQPAKQVKLVQKEGGPLLPDDDVSKVYEYLGITRDFFQGILNRDSIDGLGMNLIANVHYGKKYNNAFWDGTQMTFGDGDGEIFTSFAKSLDVTAHELAHGVTQFTADFPYKDQPGALHEHFSDVFGSAITQYHLKQDAHTADWLIGDEIMGPSLYGEALRSMKEPGTAYDNPLMKKDRQVAHMKDIYIGPLDNGGVHWNSGIPNKAFCLTAMDIGTDKAVLIWYHALQNLWKTAQFSDAVAVIVQSARVLSKNGQVPRNSPQAIRAAFRAVGL